MYTEDEVFINNDSQVIENDAVFLAAYSCI